eukprot:1147080-Pelagomonas_calceolata.AAC.1
MQFIRKNAQICEVATATLNLKARHELGCILPTSHLCGDQHLAVGLAVGLVVLQADGVQALAHSGVGLIHGQ